MRRAWLLLCLSWGCTSETVDPPSTRPMIRLARATDGSVRVELANLARPVRAVEVELSASGGANGAVVLEDASAAPGLPLDAVRVRMIGTNRAVLFAGDTRGVRISGNGELARVRARLASGAAAEGTLTIARAVVADVDGQPVEVELGGALPLR